MASESLLSGLPDIANDPVRVVSAPSIDNWRAVRSCGILIASALAVASFGIGTGADAHITQIVLGSPTAPFLKTRCRTQRKRYWRSL